MSKQNRWSRHHWLGRWATGNDSIVSREHWKNDPRVPRPSYRSVLHWSTTWWRVRKDERHNTQRSCHRPYKTGKHIHWRNTGLGTFFLTRGFRRLMSGSCTGCSISGFFVHPRPRQFLGVTHVRGLVTAKVHPSRVTCLFTVTLTLYGVALRRSEGGCMFSTQWGSISSCITWWTAFTQL